MIFLTIKKISLNRRKSKHQKWKRIKKPHKPTVNKIPLLNICSKISLHVKNNLFKWRKHNIRARVLYFDVTEIFNNFRNISQNIDLKILPSFVISISWLNIIDNISMMKYGKIYFLSSLLIIFDEEISIAGPHSSICIEIFVFWLLNACQMTHVNCLLLY